MLLAVPSIWAMAPSIELALRSDILIVAISRICAFVTLPTVSRPAVAVPFWTPAALRRRSGAGGVLRMKVKERSSKIVIWAGITWPALSGGWSLLDLVNLNLVM